MIKQNTCPSQPVTNVTVECTVKKSTDNGAFYLLWNFTNPNGKSEECTVFCKPGPVICDSEELSNVKVTDCTCNTTVIVSEATFNLTSMCDVILFCINGDKGQKQQVPASIKGR